MARLQQALGRNAPYVEVLPPPIKSQRAPTTTDTDYPIGQGWVDQSVSPNVLYFHIGGGDWNSNELTLSTDSTFTGASDSTASSSLAIKTYVDGVAVAGAPVATEVTAGIGELATDAEAVAGTPSTALVAYLLTPSNLAAVFAAPPAQGGTTPAAGTFTDLTADGTGTVSLGANAASDFSVTGAGIDLTLDSDAGRTIITGGEAAANAITIDADNAAGGIDIDAGTGGITIDSGDAISIDAAAASNFSCSAGDMTIDSAAGSLILTSGENVADSIIISADAGGIDILAPAGGAGQDIDIVNTGGSVVISASEAVTDAINIDATAGGIDMDAVGAVNIASSANGASAVVINASAGGVDITNTGTAGEDINVSSSGASVNVTSTEDAAQAIYIRANGGTSETIDIHADQGTGVASVNVHSDVGGLTFTSGLASADAININASDAAGGIDVDCGSGGFIVDAAAGAISLDSALASNFTVTGAADLTLSSSAGSVIVNGEEAVADAIQLQTAAGGIDANAALQINIDSSQAAVADSIRIVASALNGGIDVDAGTGGLTLDSTGAISIDGAAASNFSVSGAGIDLTLASAAGRVVVNGEEAAADAIRLLSAAGGLDADVALQMNLTSSQNAGDAVRINASAGGIDIDAAGAAGEDITIDNAAGSVGVSAGEAAADAVVVNASAGGLQLLAGGGAGLDTLITNTSGSMTLTAGESASDAMNITASGAAGAINLSAGTGGVTMDSGLVVNITDVATAATPYAVLGSDYVINTDSTGGALEITLPAAPATGRTLVVYDGAGQAAIGGNVTINGNGNNIAAGGSSAATKVIDTAYESYTLYYNGTIWMAQNIV